MSGASSRRRGHSFEVESANELSERTGLHIVTGRFFGLTYGSDLVTVTGYDARERPVTYAPDVLGWAIECKAAKRRTPTQWLTQATEQAAPGLRPVVLWKRPRASWEDGSAFVWDKDAPRGWWEMPIREWVAGLVPAPVE